MQTASGQAVKDSSNRNSNQTRNRRTRRRGMSPTAIAIAAFLLVLSLGVMVLALSGNWPPKSSDDNKTVAAQWQDNRTATPGTQYLNGLKVEKVGKPQRQVIGTEKVGSASYEMSTVTVTVKVTNELNVPDPKSKDDQAEVNLVRANLNTGTVRVLFYNEEDGKQMLVGGGIGTVVNLKNGESKTIEIACTPVQDYSDATQYEAFPDSIWTDKDVDKDAVEGTPTP